MAGPHWLDRLDAELRKHDLPAGYRARMLDELADHFSDLEQETASMDAPLLLEERLGDPREVAATARSAYDARTFAGRHPVLTFGIAPPLAVIGLLLLTIYTAWGVAWLVGMTTPQMEARMTPPTAVQLGVVYAIAWTMRLAPFMLMAWFFSRISRRAHRPQWGLLACALIAGLAFLFFVEVASGPGLVQGRVGFTVVLDSYRFYRFEQWLQAALPLAIGLWTWRSMIRRDRVSLTLANTT